MADLKAVCYLEKSMKPVFVASPSIITSMIESLGPEEYMRQLIELFVPDNPSKAVTVNSYCMPKKKIS